MGRESEASGRPATVDLDGLIAAAVSICRPDREELDWVAFAVFDSLNVDHLRVLR